MNNVHALDRRCNTVSLSMLSKLIDSFNETAVKQQSSYKNIVFACNMTCQIENFYENGKKPKLVKTQQMKNK